MTETTKTPEETVKENPKGIRRFTKAEAAAARGVHEQTINYWVKTKKITPGTLVGKVFDAELFLKETKNIKAKRKKSGRKPKEA